LSVAQAKDPTPPEPAPASASDEGLDVLRRASGGRLALRLGLGAVLVAGAAAGGYWAYRRAERVKVRGRPMIEFDARKMVMGNDARGREDREVGLEERPEHEVKIAPFELDPTEVTVADYRVCVDQGACTAPPKDKVCNFGDVSKDQHPINCVTQIEADTFCKWVDKRLPSEIEWEYAAGGPAIKDKRIFPWGRTLPKEGTMNACGAECTTGANISSKVRVVFDFNDGYPQTAPVGSFSDGDTPQGVKDMAGNVWEWTSSHACAYPDHDCDSGDMRIIRGGGWTHRYPLTFEVTTREKMAKGDRNEGVGFRCARTSLL
jgi:formylglycine-generating enzyme required for sulfatase activity